MMYFLLVAETLIWVFMIYTRIVIFLDETWNGLNIIFLMAYKVEKGFENFYWTFRKSLGHTHFFTRKIIGAHKCPPSKRNTEVMMLTFDMLMVCFQ